MAVVKSARRHLLEHRLAGGHGVTAVVADGGRGSDLAGALAVAYWEEETHRQRIGFTCSDSQLLHPTSACSLSLVLRKRRRHANHPSALWLQWQRTEQTNTLTRLLLLSVWLSRGHELCTRSHRRTTPVSTQTRVMLAAMTRVWRREGLFLPDFVLIYACIALTLFAKVEWKLNPPFEIVPLIPCLDFLLVSLNSRGNASLHRSWQSNGCLLIQTPLIPTEQTLPNYKQCQTHSYPAVSTSQRHRERHSLADSVETDSVCTQISHLPCALCPWPRCVCLNTPPKLARHDKKYWYAAILR